MGQSVHDRKVRLLGALGLAGALGAGMAGSAIVRAGGTQWPFWVVFPALLCVVAAAFLVTAPFWRRLDHMQRDAQLVSWYWGGLGGGAVMLMALVAAAGARSELAQGALYLMIGQAVAYGVYWLGWRWLHRGSEA